MRHKRSAHSEHLLLTSGKCSCDLLAALEESGEALIDILDARVELGTRSGICAHLKVLLNGQLQEYTSALWHVRKPHRDDLIGTNGGDILSEKLNRAGLGMQQTRYGLKNCRFSRTVSADKRDNLSLVHLKRNVLYGMDAAVVNIYIIDLQHFSSFFPRYASMTVGFDCISAGVPFAMT